MDAITKIQPIAPARPVGPINSDEPELTPGQSVIARVVGTEPDGALLLRVGSQTLRMDDAGAANAASQPGLTAGQTILLEVVGTPGNGTLTLRRLDGTPPPPVPATLRQELAEALAAIGVVADDENLHAAESLIRFGVTLNNDNLADVRRFLARGTVRRPETIAFAKARGLPLTPEVLEKIDALFADDAALPEVSLRGSPAEIAAALRHAIAGRPAAGPPPAPPHAATENAPLYAAFAVTTPRSGRHAVELTAEDGTEVAPGDATDGNTEPGITTTLHLPTRALGDVSVRLALDAAGHLTCRLATDDAAGRERLQRALGKLTADLAGAGFAAATTQTALDPASPPATPRARARRSIFRLDIHA